MHKDISEKYKINLPIISIFLIFLFFMIRNGGLYPCVLADEYLYSKFARLLSFKKAELPNYLYFFIYRLTNLTGDGFLVCARVFNTLFFIATAPFIYLTAKKVCSKTIATMIALLTLLSPINVNTAYFMPESLYFLSFWILTWYVLRLDSASPIKSYGIAGALLGMTTLIKPHAMFFIPAMMAYIFYISKNREEKWILFAIRNIAIFILATFGIKFFVSFCLAGKAGLTLFGPMYASVANTATSNLQKYVELMMLTFHSVKNHWIALCLMYGMAIASMIFTFFDTRQFNSKSQMSRKISIYGFLILFNLVFVVALFTASVANASSYESIDRLHMRYYNFIFPLLMMIVASQLNSHSKWGESYRWKILIAFPILTAILYAGFTHLAPFITGIADCPELHGYCVFSGFYLLCALALILLMIWIFSEGLSAKLFVYLFLPLSIIVSSYGVNRDLRSMQIPNEYDIAGMLAKTYLFAENNPKILIVGSDPSGIYRSMFYLDNSNTSFEVIPENSAYDLARVTPEKNWLLIIGNHSLSKKTPHEISLNGFKLVNLGEYNMSFSHASWTYVRSVAGLAAPEKWGAWATEPKVSFKFNGLPERFKMKLRLFSFLPDQDIMIHVGKNSQKLKLNAPSLEKDLIFDNPQKSDEIVIEIPQPKLLRELGYGKDEHKLGIGFVKMNIAALE